MSDAATRYRDNVVERALNGPATASVAERRAAFVNGGVDPRASALVEKIARRAWTVTDGDVAATKAAGVSEDEIFELTVCAALGQATRQLDSALAALDAATAPEFPSNERRSDRGPIVDGGVR
jgi:hypothetical protein